MGRKIMARAVLAIVAAVFAVAVAEGGYSIATGRSILRPSARASPFRLRLLDEERLKLAASTPGPYAVAEDPEVGFRLKGNYEWKILDATATTDARGLRRRPGGEPPAPARRIVVLGDSVAFGFGVADDEVLAQRLEAALAPACAGGRPVAAATVACPGWNLRNAVRFLLDHLAELEPDLVVYLANSNDLDDSYTVLETGHRSVDVDPAFGATRTHLSGEHGHEILVRVAPAAFARLGADRPEAFVFDAAFRTGQTPEARRRFEEAAATLVDLGRRLAARGAGLAVVFLRQYPFNPRLAAYLARHPDAPPVIGLFDRPQVSDALDGDPHPNAMTLDAAARRLAGEIAARKWLDIADPERIPPTPPAYAPRHHVSLDAVAIVASLREDDAVVLERLGPRIDLRTGEGFQQIYGGIRGDGGAEARVHFVLRGTAPPSSVVLELERFPVSSGVYPLSVCPAVDGVPAPPLLVPPPTDGEAKRLLLRVPLSRPAGADPFVEVELRASNRIVDRRTGTTRLLAYTFVAATLE